MLLAMAEHGVDVGQSLPGIAAEIASRTGEVIAEYNQPPVCPSCGAGALRPCAESTRLAGALVLTCSQRCGYSMRASEQWQR
jgi:hypothetical protein